MLFQCWPTVFDAVPTLKQHWVNAPCLLGDHCFISAYAPAVHACGRLKERAARGPVRNKRRYTGFNLISLDGVPSAKLLFSLWIFQLIFIIIYQDFAPLFSLEF